MLIISNFKDYYDVGQKYGVDKNIRYIRKTNIEKYNRHNVNLHEYKKDRGYFQRHGLLKYFDHIKSPTVWFNRKSYQFCPNDLCYGYVICCGKYYPFLNYLNKYFYSESEFDEYLKLNYKIFYKYYDDNKIYKYTVDVKRSYINQFFNDISELPINNNIHFELDCPIILFLDNRVNNSKVIITNPELYKYEFYKIKDVYTIFQELSMYISGVLGGQSPKLIEVDNTTKIQKHGFDVKKSFRKRKNN